jgi:hypothetical protein
MNRAEKYTMSLNKRKCSKDRFIHFLEIGKDNKTYCGKAFVLTLDGWNLNLSTDKKRVNCPKCLEK